MSPTRLRAASAACLLAVAAGTSVSVFRAAADDTKRAPAAAAKPAAAGKMVAEDAGVRAKLDETVTYDADLEQTFRHFQAEMLKKHKLAVRIDTAAFLRMGRETTDAGVSVRDRKAMLDAAVTVSAGTYTVRELITDVAVQLPLSNPTVRVKAGTVTIAPALKPAVVPGEEQSEKFVSSIELAEQIFGDPVALDVQNVPLADAVRQLKWKTGANIVIDGRCEEKAKTLVTATFEDARLLTALTVLADMCELAPVAMHGVYYLTTPENADKLQQQVNTDLFGPKPVQGIGFGGVCGQLGNLGGGFGGITGIPAGGNGKRK